MHHSTRKLNRPALVTIILLLPLLLQLPAQEFASYYQRFPYLMAPPATFEYGLHGFANPAASRLQRDFNAQFNWTIDNETESPDLRGWGFFSGFPGLSFGMQRQESGRYTVRDYNISTAIGSPGAAFGIGVTWSAGNETRFQRETLLSLGWILRPGRHLSIGVTGHFSTFTSAREGVAEIGLRPLGNHRFTLFADAALRKKDQLNNALWSAGAALELVPGLQINGRLFEDESFTIGLNLHFGNSHLGGQAKYDPDNQYSGAVYKYGLGDFHPGFITDLFAKDKSFVSMELKGRVDYQGYQIFDSGTIRLKDLIDGINNSADDPRVSVIALNLSSIRIRPEHAWEVREALQSARDKGRKVVIFIDNAQMTEYHLASVADKIMIDPEGMMILSGYVLGRTYLKGTMEKLGIGFDEWRFFKYKSAAEDFSRTNMSDPDREQRQMLIDDWHQLVRGDVTAARKISAKTFDSLIDDKVIFLPDEALQSGLVDTLCRWSNLDGVIAEVSGGKKLNLPMRMVNQRRRADLEWGNPPVIAFVYALGPCAMDSGIRGRWLEKVFLQLANNDRVKAVVFRVDSPGGDGMASDYAAEALKKCTEKKPVIISQGQVAASGGYWISMYGNRILAGPNTITGSIGVIGGWVYNDGFAEKVGMSSDKVQTGKHADLFSGIRIPLLGLQLPERNLDEAEREMIEQLFMKFYSGFVGKVAKGRNMSEERVREIAEGRIYSGWDGLENGLVDEIGGMVAAVNVALEMAGMSQSDRYQVVEIPKYKGFFNTDQLNPLPVAAEIEKDPVVQWLRMMSEHPGRPVPMLLPGTYPDLD